MSLSSTGLEQGVPIVFFVLFPRKLARGLACPPAGLPAGASNSFIAFRLKALAGGGVGGGSLT